MSKTIVLATDHAGFELKEHVKKFLLEKGYRVHGTVRRSSTFNTSRIEPLIAEYSQDNKLNLHYSDLLDSSSLNNLISNTNPDEIYNLSLIHI